MKYIILKKHQVTTSMLEALGMNVIPTPIYMTEPEIDIELNESAYCFLKSRNKFPNSFERYKKLSLEEFDSEVVKIRLNDDPDNVVKESNKTEALADPAGFRFRGARIIAQTIKSTDLVEGKYSIDYVIPAARYIEGAQFRAVDCHPFDYISFDIVNPSTDAVMESFVQSWGISDQFQDLRIYKAYLFQGLILRVTYHKVGTEDINLIVNAYLHRLGKGV